MVLQSAALYWPQKTTRCSSFVHSGHFTKLTEILLGMYRRFIVLQGNWFVLVATHSHVSIPPNQKGTLAKDGFSESGKCIGNLLMILRVGVCVQSRRAAVCLCMWPPKSIECSDESHMQVWCESDWPRRV